MINLNIKYGNLQQIKVRETNGHSETQD